MSSYSWQTDTASALSSICGTVLLGNSACTWLNDHGWAAKESEVPSLKICGDAVNDGALSVARVWISTVRMTSLPQPGEGSQRVRVVLILEGSGRLAIPGWEAAFRPRDLLLLDPHVATEIEAEGEIGIMQITVRKDRLNDVFPLPALPARATDVEFADILSSTVNPMLTFGLQPHQPGRHYMATALEMLLAATLQQSGSIEYPS